MKTFLVLAAVIFNFTAPLNAQEFAYVTDSLQLRVYESASASSNVLQTIDSGDSVEVFATESGFSKISTYDGTEGWVKSAFLVPDPPAKLLYYSVGEKNKELEAEIESLKSAVTSSSAVGSSEADLNQIKELQTQLEQQQQSNQALQMQLDESNAEEQASTNPAIAAAGVQSVKAPLNKKWLLVGSLALLLAGLLLGVKVSSWRMRKRLHGFSI